MMGYKLSEQIMKAEGLVPDPSTPGGYRLAKTNYVWCCGCCGTDQTFPVEPPSVQCDNPECGYPGPQAAQ